MEQLLLEVIDLMVLAEQEPVTTGVDKKSRVLRDAARLLPGIDLMYIDAFIDVVCMLNKNRRLLNGPRTRCFTCM